MEFTIADKIFLQILSFNICTYEFLNTIIQIYELVIGVANKTEMEKSLFLQFFGDKPKFRMIDFLLENELRDFTKTEIAKGAGLSWAALFSHWDEMEKKKIVKVTRTVGRVKLYQLNSKSPLVMLLRNIEMTLIKEAAEAAEDKASMRMVAQAKTRR